MEYFMNKWLKAYRLPNFNMLFQFVLTKANCFGFYRKLITWSTNAKGQLELTGLLVTQSITINNIMLLFQPLDSKVSIKNCILCTADLRAIRTSSKPSVWTLSRSKINLVSCSSRKINSLSPGERGAKINNDLNNNWKCIK